jgi:hypothetical protein
LKVGELSIQELSVLVYMLAAGFRIGHDIIGALM